MVIQYILLIICAAAIAFVWRRARQDALSRTTALLWTVVWALGGILALRPGVATFFAHLFGVGRGADLAIYLSLALAYYLMFRMYVRIEMLEQRITELVRKLALKEGGASQPMTDRDAK